MACGGCKTKYKEFVENLSKTKEFPIAAVYKQFRQFGGLAYYLAAPRVIPEYVDYVWIYGKKYMVLHLYQRICKDGTYTPKPEWSKIKAGEYVDDRSWAKVIIHEDLEDDMMPSMVSRYVNKKIIEIGYITNDRVRFVWNEELEAVELDDDKPDVVYWDNEDGELNRYYPWMELDTDVEQKEHYLDIMAELHTDNELAETAEFFLEALANDEGTTDDEITRAENTFINLLASIRARR